MSGQLYCLRTAAIWQETTKKKDNKANDSLRLLFPKTSHGLCVQDL